MKIKNIIDFITEDKSLSEKITAQQFENGVLNPNMENEPDVYEAYTVYKQLLNS